MMHQIFQEEVYHTQFTVGWFENNFIISFWISSTMVSSFF